MPFTIVTLGEQVSSHQAGRLAVELTALLESDLDKKPHLSVVQVHGPSQCDVFVGNQPNPVPASSVQVHITADTTTPDQRDTFVRHVHQTMVEHGHASGPAYVVVHELPADSWGYDGCTQAARLGLGTGSSRG